MDDEDTDGLELAQNKGTPKEVQLGNRVKTLENKIEKLERKLNEEQETLAKLKHRYDQLIETLVTVLL